MFHLCERRCEIVDVRHVCKKDGLAVEIKFKMSLGAGDMGSLPGNHTLDDFAGVKKATFAKGLGVHNLSITAIDGKGGEFRVTEQVLGSAEVTPFATKPPRKKGKGKGKVAAEQMPLTPPVSAPAMCWLSFKVVQPLIRGDGEKSTWLLARHVGEAVDVHFEEVEEKVMVPPPESPQTAAEREAAEKQMDMFLQEAAAKANEEFAAAGQNVTVEVVRA